MSKNEVTNEAKHCESPAWAPIATARVDGAVCDLRFRDPLGAYEVSGCFLHDDGNWYRIEPPTLITKQPTHWRVNHHG